MLSNMKLWPSGVWLAVILATSTAIAQQPSPGSNVRNEARIESISGLTCKGGLHTQPEGPFGVYVFCDDALGTNIAVFYPQLGEPRYEKWTLTRRFWQDEPWSADVSALGWVPGRNLLVVTTSYIYGTGAVYLLNLEKQSYTNLGSTNDCGSVILTLTESVVKIGLVNCEDSKPAKNIELKFSQDVAK
jgi:hypothetical protein